MGVLTDWILGTEAELATVPLDAVPINVLPGLDIKGIDLIKLDMLLGLLTGRGFEPGLTSFPAVQGQESEDGPWVFRCSDDLIAKLASLPESEVASVASRWAATEEFRLDGWDPEQVLSTLNEMRAFAQRAMAESKPVHIWTSL